MRRGQTETNRLVSELAGRQLRDLSSVNFSDPFGWDTEGCQEVVFQFVTVWLDSEGALHTEEPGIALCIAYWESFVSARNADWPIVLLIQPRATKPTTEEVGEFLS